MRKISGARRVAGVALLVSGVLLVAAPLALRAYSMKESAQPVGSAPPLTSTELGVVGRSRAAVAALPKALALVPTAMIDGAAAANPKAAAMTEAAANGLLSRPDLDVLERAVQAPEPIAAPLSRALSAAADSAHPARFPSLGLLLVLFGLPGLIAVAAGLVVLTSARGGRSMLSAVAPAACLVAAAWIVVAALVPVVGGRSVVTNALRGRQVSHELSVPLGAGQPAVSSSAATTTMQANLNLLQSVYADIVPAIEAAATSVGGNLSDRDAVNVVVTDPRLVPLRQLITGLSSIYGAGILSVQAAAAANTAANTRRAATDLPLVGLPLVLALLVGAFAAAPRSRARFRTPVRDWDTTAVPGSVRGLGVPW